MSVVTRYLLPIAVDYVTHTVYRPDNQHYKRSASDKLGMSYIAYSQIIKV